MQGGFKVGDNRDAFGRPRFVPHNLSLTMHPEHMGDVHKWEYARYVPRQVCIDVSEIYVALGIQLFECCADTMIAWHYVSPEQMYEHEIQIYNFHPFSIRDTWI